MNPFAPTALYHSVRNVMVARRHAKKYREWERSGKQQPPPHLAKQRALREYGRQFGIKTLCETGTFRGDMIHALRDDFDCICSIELSPQYHRKALKRFAGDDGVVLIQGDSGVELESLLDHFQEPVLFWLDGHYSEGDTARGELDTPIYEELRHILGAKQGHVVVIDDAHCFGSDPGYPTLEALAEFVQGLCPNRTISTFDGMIRVLPGQENKASVAA